MKINRRILSIALPLIALLFILIHSGEVHSIANKHARQLYLKYSFNSVDKYRVALYSNNDMDQLRRNLSIHFPYRKNTDEIPKKIWQIWKTTDRSSLDENLQKLISSWSDQEGFEYNLLQDTKLTDFIRAYFIDTAPQVIEALDKLPVIVLKADFMRYILMFVHGGVYSDIDTKATRNITKWLSYENDITPINQIGLVFGIESDRDEKDWARNSMARRLQYCQWTLQSKPHHPMYRELISRIVDVTLNDYNAETMILKAKDGKIYDLHKGSKTRQGGILQWTGPATVTDTLFDYLNEVYKYTELLDPSIDFKNDKMIDPNRDLDLLSKVRYPRLKGAIHNEYDPVERPIGWQNFTKQEKPVLFDDDVLLLPHISFGNREGGDLDYVMHYFKGSWKKE